MDMNDRATVVRDVIYARRSVRRYVEGKQVDDQTIVELLKAGMAAPTACNLQPWEFVVVTDPDVLTPLKAATSQGDYNAPMAMVILGNTKCVPWEGEDWKIDCSAAVENMMLLAAAMGLGSVWLGAFDEDKVRALLDIPDNIAVMNIVYFGYPAWIGRPKTRYDESAVFFQRYDPARERNMRTIDMLMDASTTE